MATKMLQQSSPIEAHQVAQGFGWFCRFALKYAGRHPASPRAEWRPTQMHHRSQTTLPAGTPFSSKKGAVAVSNDAINALGVFGFIPARCSSGRFNTQRRPNKCIKSLAFGSLGRATAARRPAPYAGR